MTNKELPAAAAGEYDRWYDAVVAAMADCLPLPCPFRGCPAVEHQSILAADQVVSWCNASGFWYQRSWVMPDLKPVYLVNPAEDWPDPLRWVQHNPWGSLRIPSWNTSWRNGVQREGQDDHDGNAAADQPE